MAVFEERFPDYSPNKMSRDGIRRFVPYKPNSQVQAFFNDLKKRRIPAPVNETVHVSSRPVKGADVTSPTGYKKRRGKKSVARKAAPRKQSTSAKSSHKSKKQKTVDKKLRGVKL